MAEYYGESSGEMGERHALEAQAARDAEYTGPMVDTEGRGARLSRERINGRLADVFREQKIRIVGSGFPNETGPSRQEIIGGVAVGDIVEFRREPLNPFDPNAIACDYFNAEQGPDTKEGPIGYIGKNIAAGIAVDMDSDWKPLGLVYEVKQVGPRKEWAVNIYLFTWAEPPLEMPRLSAAFELPRVETPDPFGLDRSARYNESEATGEPFNG